MIKAYILKLHYSLSLEFETNKKKYSKRKAPELETIDPQIETDTQTETPPKRGPGRP